MRRDSHRRRGAYRASSGGWGHRAVYIGAVVATAAVLAGFGSAVLIYSPIGKPYKQASASTTPIPPPGVLIGGGAGGNCSSIPNVTCALVGEEIFASGLILTNASAGNQSWNWTGGGPCAGAGVLNASNEYQYYTNASTAVADAAGNVTLVCLNSVNNGTLNATWYWDNLTGHALTTNNYNSSGYMPNGSSFANGYQNLSACNDPANTGYDGWNATHIDDANFTPCSTYYEMNNNTTIIPSWGGVSASTIWSPAQMGYLASDVVYQIPVVFTNLSDNTTFEIAIAIGGVTPVSQVFFVNNTMHGGTGYATVLFTFDLTAAWLYDTSYNDTGGLAPSNETEIYGAIGVASIIVSECSQYGSGCPQQEPIPLI